MGGPAGNSNNRPKTTSPKKKAVDISELTKEDLSALINSIRVTNDVASLMGAVRAMYRERGICMEAQIPSSLYKRYNIDPCGEMAFIIGGLFQLHREEFLNLEKIE